MKITCYNNQKEKPSDNFYVEAKKIFSTGKMELVVYTNAGMYLAMSETEAKELVRDLQEALAEYAKEFEGGEESAKSLSGSAVAAVGE